MIEIRGMTVGFGNDPGNVSVDIIPNKALRIFGTHSNKDINIMFKVGDTFVSGSYNLIYTEQIIGITEKNVIYTENGGSIKKRMKMNSFVMRNYDFDIARINKHNHEVGMTI